VNGLNVSSATTGAIFISVVLHLRSLSPFTGSDRLWRNCSFAFSEVINAPIDSRTSTGFRARNLAKCRAAVS